MFATISWNRSRGPTGYSSREGYSSSTAPRYVGKVVRRADLLPVVEGVADAAGVVLDGVGEVGADDVQVARQGNHVVLAVWGRILDVLYRRAQKSETIFVCVGCHDGFFPFSESPHFQFDLLSIHSPYIEFGLNDVGTLE